MRAVVTGGAGFIGSHLADALVAEGHDVVVLDDLSTGRRGNAPSEARLIEGSVADEEVVRSAVEGAEVVFHEGALGSVQRSLERPLDTDRVNTHGTLTVLEAAREAGVRRVVYASSSSVYGGVAPLPTTEDAPVRPRSPYAVSKHAGERYCRVFAELFELETVSLRYFNIFGPRQRPDSPYAAAIPLFIDALASGQRPTVHGDGLQSRDFTAVANAVDANLRAAAAPAEACSGRVLNVATGSARTLLDLLDTLGELLDARPEPVFTEARPGDVRASLADVSDARRALGYEPAVGFEEGLERTVEWFRAQRPCRRGSDETFGAEPL